MRGSRSTISMVLAVGLLAGSAVAVEAQDEAADPMAPAWVTGTLSFANHCEDPTVTVGDEVTQEYGYHCHPQTWTSDDPRLGGAADSLWNADVYSVDGTRYSVLSSLIDIHDENGGWSCRDDSGLDIGSGLFTTSVQGTVKTTAPAMAPTMACARSSSPTTSPAR